MQRHQSLSFGASIQGESCTFRLWAPDAERVAVHLDAPQSHPASMLKTPDGWHEVVLPGAGAGDRYRFMIDGRTPVPDPASRFNPEGIDGPSEVIDPAAFVWTDDRWRGRPWHEAVIYEVHVGTFSDEGTYAGLSAKLPALARLGITCIELMPVATYPGSRGWGYDGVLLFAPQPGYGRPEELKSLVQAAHALGISVILDVVYNHFGPHGNYLGHYAKAFFTDRHHTPWGNAINFDGDSGRAVRDFYLQNALYWINEYHMDGLRLDAIHAIKDDSPVHIVDELAAALEQGPAQQRHIHLVLENGSNEARRLTPSATPRLSKAQWNDDSHHAMHVLLTQERDGYFMDYAAAPLRHLGRVLAEGFAFQGEVFEYDGGARGEPSRHLPATSFINFLQNHDQVGNRAFGERIGMLCNEDRLRVLTAVLLLSPSPPMLFMGDEFKATSPFLYFCDYEGELAAAITAGRRMEFAGFAAFSDDAVREGIPDPNSRETFERSHLRWDQPQQSPHNEFQAFVAAALAVRHSQIVPLIPLIVPGTATYEVSNDVLDVRWPLNGGRKLMLKLNCSGEPVPVATDNSIYSLNLASSMLNSWGLHMSVA
jgi:maltooligosyltrehalose trehalohydrolase